MSDYSQYSFKGFWFQPERVEMQDANPYSNHGFLKKYWGEGSLGSTPPNQWNDYYNSYDMFPNDYYSGANYGEYTKNPANKASDYDTVINNFKNQIGTQSGSQSRDKYNLDAYFSADYDGYVKQAEEDGFSYDNVINELNEQIGKTAPTGDYINSGSDYTSNVAPDCKEYFDSIFN